MQSVSIIRALQVCHIAIKFNQVRPLSLTFRRMDGAMDHLKSNPYFDKYANKINKLKDSHPCALVSAVQERQNEIKSDATDPMASAAGVRKISAKAAKPKSILPSGGYGFAPPKKLESIIKVKLLQYKTPEEITYLWTEHFKTKPVISGVIKSEFYKTISERAAIYDKFLFPLPREQGYEFVLAQFTPREIHFTPLINFQAYGENAPECLTIAHYTELEDKHSIVLMKGEFDSKLISNKEAQFLANQMQLYYSGHDEKKTEILERFYKDPTNFNHMELVNELEQLDLSSITKKH